MASTWSVEHESPTGMPILPDAEPAPGQLTGSQPLVEPERGQGYDG
jgi:hypothetical protein